MEAKRLRKIRRELDEAAEWVERLAADLEAQTSSTALDLVGQAEIAAMTKTNRSTVGVWVARGKLPAPVAKLACGTIWLRADIERWAKAKTAAAKAA